MCSAALITALSGGGCHANTPDYKDSPSNVPPSKHAVYQRLLRAESKEHKNRSFLISVAGLNQALGLLWIGSEGNTHSQIGNIYRPSSLDNDHQHSSAAVWTQKRYKPSRKFVSTARLRFGAETGSLDFGTQAGKRLIDDWIRTHGGDGLSGLPLSSATQFVVADVFSLNEMWLTRFQPARTVREGFFGAKRIGKAWFMRAMIVAPVARGKHGIFLNLPFKSGDSMLLFLPNGTSATALQSMLADSTRTFDSQPLKVELPRFATQTRLMLGPVLSHIGMPMAFAPNANFSPLLGVPNIPISIVYQQSRIEVKEKGAHLSSITEAADELKGRLTLKFNRPFAYEIVSSDRSLIAAGQVESL